MKEEDTIRLTIRVSKELVKEFDKCLEGKDTSRSREIREMIRKYIKQQQEVGMKEK